MTKGIIWLNSNCVGRYWLTPSKCFGDFKPEDPTIKVEALGAPSQSLYHLPLEWLKEKNDIIIFDKNSASPNRIKLYIVLNFSSFFIKSTSSLASFQLVHIQNLSSVIFNNPKSRAE